MVQHNGSASPHWIKIATVKHHRALHGTGCNWLMYYEWYACICIAGGITGYTQWQETCVHSAHNTRLPTTLYVRSAYTCVYSKGKINKKLQNGMHNTQNSLWWKTMPFRQVSLRFLIWPTKGKLKCLNAVLKTSFHTCHSQYSLSKARYQVKGRN